MKRSLLIVAALVSVILVPLQRVDASTSEYRVVALGDSYSSGNGALEYFHQECYRSSNSYVYQFADQVSAQRAVRADNFACHGNVTSDVASQIREGRTVLSQADLVTITVGGNDGNFKDVVIDCLAATRHFQLCHDEIDTARDGLDNTVASVRQALLSVHDAAPNADVVLIGYPYLIARDCFADADIVRSLQAAADTHMFLMVDELQKQGQTWVHYLSMLVPFAGGEVCGDSGQLIRGSFDTANFNEWWHPNVEGHAVIAREVAKLNLYELRETEEPAPNAPTPIYTTPPPTDGQPVYADMPFECGVIVSHVSTYGSMVLENTTYHHGHAIDMPMKEGTPVVAPEAGRVEVTLGASGYGKYVDLHGDSGTLHRMAHLAHPSVSDGQRVVRGQRVGLVGSTGASTGPHLHYEQRRGGVQVAIELGGPGIAWGNPFDSTGYRHSSHALVSGNCAGGVSRAYEDMMTLSYNHFAWGRSDGRARDQWGTAKQNVFTPESVDSCDFDGDGWDEYIVLDVDTSRVMIADPKGSPNGHFYWRQIGTTTTARKIVCGDWNNDGLDDVMFHNIKNVIYFGRSDGERIAEWRVARLNAGSRPTYWDICDINGDGKDDVVSYHAGTERFLAGYRAEGVTMHRVEIKANIPDVGGFTCGNFKLGGSEEIILWNAGSGGRFILGRFDLNYTTTSWYAFNRTGIKHPHNGEMAAADVDGDGVDEIFVNIRRNDLGIHKIYVLNITGTKDFEWYYFQDGMQASFLAGGEFVR